MKKSNKFLDGPKYGMPISVLDIVLMPFLFMLVMSIGFLIADWVVQGLYTVGLVNANLLGEVYYYVQLIFGFGLGILVLFLFVRRTGKRSIKTLGFYNDQVVIKYAQGVLLAFSGLLSMVIILQNTGNITIKLNPYTLSLQTISIILLVIVAWVIQGAAEEILIRGFLLTSISERWGLVRGIIISSIVFALMHVGNNGLTFISLMNLLLCGVLLALLAIKQESLWGAAGFHTAWNLLQGNVFGIAVSGTDHMASLWETSYEAPNLMNGGVFGIEGSILTTLFMIIGIIILVSKIKREYDLQALISE